MRKSRSFEWLLVVAEAHYPYLVYVTNSKHWSAFRPTVL